MRSGDTTHALSRRFLILTLSSKNSPGPGNWGSVRTAPALSPARARVHSVSCTSVTRVDPTKEPRAASGPRRAGRQERQAAFRVGPARGHCTGRAQHGSSGLTERRGFHKKSPQASRRRPPHRLQTMQDLAQPGCPGQTPARRLPAGSRARSVHGTRVSPVTQIKVKRES